MTVVNIELPICASILLKREAVCSIRKAVDIAPLDYRLRSYDMRDTCRDR